MKFKFGFQIEMDDGVVNPPQIVVDGTELLDAYLSEGDDSDTAEGLSEGEIAPIGVAKFQTELGEDIDAFALTDAAKTGTGISFGFHAEPVD